MNWWHRVFGKPLPPAHLAVNVMLALPGWSEHAPQGGMRVWRNEDGDALTMTPQPMALPDLTESASVQDWCRKIAEGSSGGLIQSSADPNVFGGCVWLIHKQLRLPAYLFTGMLFASEPAVVWTVVSKERGTTGVREAMVTADLLQEKRLTLADYQQSFAQDPYDASYRGVDRRALRFMSDDEIYDDRFPSHPLSKVRRVLAALPEAVHVG